MTFEEEEFDGKQSDLTSIKTVLAGRFNLSVAAVPYFQTSLPLRQVCHELQLVESLRADFQQHWQIEELFQRDLDWERVDTDIVYGYLERPEKRTFFNSLTVALLPLTNDGILTDEYGTPDVELPKDGPFGSANFSLRNIGGIQLALPRKENAVVGYLRWDRKKIFAATIDGQHRLAALRRFLHENEVSLTSKQLDTSVPVIFLILDERAGFRLEDDDEEHANRLLPIVREVFIDLNKHARTVSETRQVLLNDLEVEAVCTRSLIADQIAVDSVSELPLGLVNWKNDRIKFDTGPYMTAVYALYLVVKDVLELKHPKNPTDPDQMLAFANSIEQRLNLWDVMSSGEGIHARSYGDLPRLVQFVQEKHVAKEVPFKSPPKGYILAARDAFDRVYKPLLMGVFLQLDAYREFWELSRSLGGIDGELAFYNGESEKVQQRLENETWGSAKFEKVVTQSIARLSSFKVGRWPFFVVFQKALLRSTISAFFSSPVVLGEEEPSLQDFQRRWYGYLNALEARGALRVGCPLRDGSSGGGLWEGVALNPVSMSIRWSDSAARRVEDILVLGWYFENSGYESPTAFVSSLEQKSVAARFPDSLKLIKRVDSALRSVAKQRGQLEDEDEIAVYAASRFMDVLATLRG